MSLLAISVPAFAQSAADDSQDAAANNEDIVVTGTLIRGTKAVGSQTITTDAKQIAEVGAVSTNALLASIPQIAGSFNSRPEGDPRGLTAVSSIVRPNLRNFPSSNATSGALTLVLLDGMRITPVGANASSVDPDVIPSNVLAGVDIVTDGGSSLYGADAVAGVMNFRTMRKFDGVKLDANYGFGTKITGFKEWDASIIAGTSWSTGNVYAAYSHASRDSITNGETTWSNQTLYTTAGVARNAATQCNTPQSTVYRYVYVPSYGVWTSSAQAGGGLIPTGTGCDTSLEGTYLPSLKRDNVFVALSNTFSDSVDLRVTGYWTKRTLGLPSYPLGHTSKYVTPATPVGAPGTAGAPASSPVDYSLGTGGVGFALGPNAAYVNTPSLISMETWGITPELTVKLGGTWQVRTSLHFGRSQDATHFPGLNTTQVNCYIDGCTGIAAGQINPSNIAAASAAVIADITNWETAQKTTHELFVMKSVADGTIFSLPGGDAKLAVGIEYQNNTDGTQVFTGKLGGVDTAQLYKTSRNVKSIFGELHLPVTTFLDLAASGRYDHYSDFGGTFNPNFGATLTPTPWLKIFGHWGKSYNAPTAYDNLAIGYGRAGQQYTSSRPTVATGKSDDLQGTYFLVLTGSSPTGIKPQTSTAWAVGFEATPLDGLSLGAEYYSIDLQNMIGSMSPAVASTYQTNPENYIYHNELNTVQANGKTLYENIMADVVNRDAILAQIGGSNNLAILIDTRTNNLNSAKVAGIDMHVNYQTDTSFGQLTFTNNATLQTRAIIKNGTVTTNELGHGGPRFTWASTAGWAKSGFSAKVTVNFSGKWRDSAVDYLGVETQVSPFVVTNLNLGYDFGDRGGPLAGTSLRLIVNNLFDVEPTTVRRSNVNAPSYVNWTLGRVIKLGVTKKF
ncbi:MAG: TonB-dependent receptor [Novosphingobium sp.]